ncbi:unnamed protein product [Protopolystoma xenopodis]|uniref:Uncharacterized protein n=1 Tax=Protopolystoma xenopodis TaxID=117903 RepID=A0A3S5CDG6_9PLAT|nr:unnamed protein product [Protopolystoma xenopodis]
MRIWKLGYNLFQEGNDRLESWLTTDVEEFTQNSAARFNINFCKSPSKRPKCVEENGKLQRGQMLGQLVSHSFLLPSHISIPSPPPLPSYPYPRLFACLPPLLSFCSPSSIFQLPVIWGSTVRLPLIRSAN